MLLCVRSRRAMAEPVRPRTASQSSPLKRSRIENPAQELQPAVRERREELVADVIGEQAIVAGKAGDGAAHVVLGEQRQPGQVESRGPALGPFEQGVELGGGEPHPEGREHGGPLGLGHRQLATAELDQQAAGAQLRQRQGRVGAGGDGDLGAGTGVLRQGGDHRQRLRRLEMLELVDDEDGAAAAGGKRFGQPRQHGDLDVGRRPGERSGDAVRQRLDPVERVEHPLEQEDRVVVGVAEGQRGEGTGVAGGPLREENGLAVAAGSAEQDQRSGRALQLLEQARARDQAGKRRARQVDPGDRVALRRAPVG